ncbi:MAG: response regulator transcription factor [Clostridia bacterium]|nr:response regulator transcription factor [Clostridia bacterium]
MKGKIWILEDDASICGLVKVALEMNGLEMQAYNTIASFEQALEEDTPDVALLDIMLPDGSGLDVLKYVKSRCPSVAVIMLTAKGREEDKVTGLNMGADDYVTKPFSVLELTARVNARLRGREKRGEIAAKGVIIDIDRMSATLDGEPLVLNKKEYELLKYFVENAGKALPREKLLTEVWGYDQGETRTLDNHVARLRKLGVKIETVFGVGYRF